MGRTFDGGYAEYTCVPARQVVPFTSSLDWATLGAVPEMLQTAHGSLTVGLDAQPGQSILIRGGTSSVGMTTAVLAKRLGMTVLSTTRNPGKDEALKAIGADPVLIDDGRIAERVRYSCPQAWMPPWSWSAPQRCPTPWRRHGCTGWCASPGCCPTNGRFPTSTPFDYIPRGVCLTAYSGGARDLPARVLQEFLDAVALGDAVVPLHRVYHLDEIRKDHTEMEAGSATGKIVVLTEGTTVPLR